MRNDQHIRSGMLAHNSHQDRERSRRHRQSTLSTDRRKMTGLLPRAASSVNAWRFLPFSVPTCRGSSRAGRRAFALQVVRFGQKPRRLHRSVQRMHKLPRCSPPGDYASRALSRPFIESEHSSPRRTRSSAVRTVAPCLTRKIRACILVRPLRDVARKDFRFILSRARKQQKSLPFPDQRGAQLIGFLRFWKCSLASLSVPFAARWRRVVCARRLIRIERQRLVVMSHGLVQSARLR